MDYSNGVALYKYQWDRMRYPEIVMGLFEGDDAGALANATWFTPDWRPFTVGDITRTISSSSNELVPQGTIPGMKITGADGKDCFYVAKFKEDGTFSGYYCEGNGNPLKITYRDINASKIKDNDLIYLFQKNGGCGSDKYYHTNFKYANEKRTAIDYNEATVIDHGIVPCTGKSNQEPNSEIINRIASANDSKEALDLINKQLVKPSTNEFTGKEIALKQTLFITYLADAASSENEAAFKNYDVGSDKVIFWITYDKANKTVALKSVRYPTVVKSQAQETLSRIWNDIQTEPFNIQYILLYELSDLLSKGLEYLIIPPYVYNCGDPKYKTVYPKIFSYLNIATIVATVVPFEVLQGDISKQISAANSTVEQIKFAFYCGIWNGLVTVVKSVPDLVNVAASPFSPTGRKNHSEKARSFAEMVIVEGKDTICLADQYPCKVWELTKSAAKAAFANACVGAHTVGSIAGPIIVACFGDVAALTGEAGTVSAAMQTTIKFLQWCDRAGDIFTYFAKFGKVAFTLAKGPGGALLAKLEVNGIALVRQEGETFIVKKVIDGQIVEQTLSRSELEKLSKGQLEEVLVKLTKGGVKFDDVVKKLDNLNLSNLKSKASALDEAAKSRFADDIADLSDDALRELDDNFGLVDEWKKIDGLDDAAKKSSKPEWLKKIQDGNAFNKERSAFYPYNEVYIKKPDGSGYYRLDSYKLDEEIVSRKFTQLGDIQEQTAFSYLQELKTKYPVEAEIANVPTSQKLLGEISKTGKAPRLRGELILEVPVQNRNISQNILDFANKNDITIRDINGRIYNN
jgi:hypothetical protein